MYQPSSGALYPALARLVGKGLIRHHGPTEPGRHRVVYEATPSGRTTNLAWIRLPVRPATVSGDLGLHLMRFVMMGTLLSRDEVLDWLRDLIDALSVFVADVERYRAAVTTGPRTSYWPWTTVLPCIEPAWPGRRALGRCWRPPRPAEALLEAPTA